MANLVPWRRSFLLHLKGGRTHLTRITLLLGNSQSQMESLLSLMCVFVALTSCICMCVCVWSHIWKHKNQTLTHTFTHLRQIGFTVSAELLELPVCLFVCLSAGIMTGSFYSISTLLNQMIMTCYEVKWAHHVLDEVKRHPESRWKWFGCYCPFKIKAHLENWLSICNELTSQ